MDKSSARAVNVGDEEECDGDDQGQKKKQAFPGLDAMRTVADQHITANGDRNH